MDEIERLKLKSGKVLVICRDEDAEDPRKGFDNLGVMVCFHRRYNLGDKHDYKPDNYGSRDEMMKDIIAREKPAVILPLWLYDHSGITMSVGENPGYPFTDRWDAGQVGYIFARREDVLKEYGKKRVSPQLRKLVETVLRGEVETYDNYLTGNVYGYRVVKEGQCSECGHEEEEEFDACWGFYGEGWEESGILEAVKESGEEVLHEDKKPAVSTSVEEVV